MHIIKHIIPVIALSFSLTEVKAQGGFDITHDFCTDTPVASSIFSAYADSDRFFVTGVTLTQNVSPEHGFLAAFNYSGQHLWSKKMLYPGKYNSSLSYKGIVKTGLLKYISLGSVFDYDINPDYQVWQPYLYCFTDKGDSLWYKCYIDSFKSRAFNTVLYDNGTIITAGSISSANLKNFSLWLCKYDSIGNLLWEKKYMTNSIPPDYLHIVLSADKKHYLIAGRMFDTTVNWGRACMVKTDTMGNLIWVKSLPKKYDSWNYMDIVTNPGGGYYFVSSNSLQPPSGGIPTYSYIYYGKLDEQGDTLWTRTLTDSFYYAIGYQIAWSPDSTHLLINASDYTEALPVLAKIDTSGSLLWFHHVQHYYNFTIPWLVPAQVLHSLSVSPFDKYLMAGYARDTVTYGNLSWINLLDSSGCRYPGDPACWPLAVHNVESVNNEVSIYPNPTTGSFTITSPRPSPQVERGALLSIYNMQGQVVATYNITQQKTNITLPSSLNTGVYMGRFTETEGNKTYIIRLVYNP